MKRLEGLPVKIKDTWLTDETGWRKVRTRTEGEFWQRVSGCLPDGVGDPESLIGYGMRFEFPAVLRPTTRPRRENVLGDSR